MTSWRFIEKTDGFATERGSTHFVDFIHNACGERVAMATQIGHITKVDADYGGNNHAIVSLWMRVPLEPNAEPSNANPAKGPMTDYMCKCGKKIGELYTRNPDPYDGDDDVRCKLMVRSKNEFTKVDGVSGSGAGTVIAGCMHGDGR